MTTSPSLFIVSPGHVQVIKTFQIIATFALAHFKRIVYTPIFELSVEIVLRHDNLHVKRSEMDHQMRR